MKNVDFFGHQVSKLIVGDKLFTGHSYIASHLIIAIKKERQQTPLF